MNKDALIYYSYIYNGDYYKIYQAIIENKPYQKLEIENVITILDKDYPQEFLYLKEKPFVLYYKGNLDLLHKRKIAIVGSRNINDKFFDITKIVSDKLKNKYTLVSGLALGVDSIVHKANTNNTIAILGCGINYYYPLKNKLLQQEIENYGLVLSEYPNDTLPLKHHFRFRNRMIAALGDKLLVTYARKNSGTFITINYALNLNKEIYVVPCDIFEDSYNNHLINEGANILFLKDLELI